MSERCAPKKNFCQFHDTKTVTVWRICSYARQLFINAIVYNCPLEDEDEQKEKQEKLILA